MKNAIFSHCSIVRPYRELNIYCKMKISMRRGCLGKGGSEQVRCLLGQETIFR